ncbi:hypothetical protein MLD38_037999 [Melastoma candidum]|uniref:Uncharacterized protein n=1 Tax=Melastoma candidum TaxID=119954 RepID=A0ACB9KYI8_9MYRT|nr:hypothetical protein MLD38_037999 [Melastoma candidum]
MEHDLVNQVQESEMEFGAWEEDEFYVELRRQILMILEDDDNKDNFTDARYGTFDRLMRRDRGSPLAVCSNDFFSMKKMEAGATPMMQVHLARSISGTGVFIPTVVGPSRTVLAGRKRRGRRLCKKLQGEC